MFDKNHSSKQKELFERIHDEYEAHYYDYWSMAYRNKYFYDPLLKNVDLNGVKVADLACGSGYTSLYLKKRFPNIHLTGFDISSSACEAYKNNTGFDAICLDLSKKAEWEGYLKNKFSAAIIIGGLHHCVADLEMTFNNIFNLLQPESHFFMVEPNSKYVLEPIRKLWYRTDKRLFDAVTEHALSHDEILTSQNKYVNLAFVQYGGGPAYYLIYNSLILRLPKWLKNIISPILLYTESVFNKLPFKLLHGYFIARWEVK